MSIPAISNQFPNLKSSYSLEEPSCAKAVAGSSTEKISTPEPVLLAGPAPAKQSGYDADSIRDLLEDLRDSEVSLQEKVKIYRSIQKKHPGSAYLAEAMLELGLAYGNKGRTQEAISIYQKLTRMKKFKGTRYARQAFSYLGDIYSGMDKLNVALKFYTASLNKKRPETNLPTYYEMAQLFEDDEKKAIIPKRALNYYLLFYKNYLLLKRLYSRRNIIIKFDAQGFSMSDPYYLIKVMLRLLKMYLAKGKISLAIQMLKELFFLLNGLNEIPDEFEKECLKIAKKLCQILEKHLSSKKNYKLLQILKGISLAISALDKIPEELAQIYVKVMERYNRKGKYDAAIKVHTLADYSLAGKTIKGFCNLRIDPFCQEEKVNIAPELDIEAASSYKRKWLGLKKKAENLRARGGGRNRNAAERLDKQAGMAFLECINLYKKFGKDSRYYSTARLQLGGLYEIAGNPGKAIENYKEIIASASIYNGEKTEAKIRIAFLRRDVGALKKIAKEGYDITFSSLIEQLSKLSISIKKAIESGQPGLIMTHVFNSFIIRRFRDYYFFYNVQNFNLLTIIRGSSIRIREKRIEISRDKRAGRNFRIIFKCSDSGKMPEVIENYNAMASTMKKMPKGVYRGLSTIIFDDKTPEETAGSCWGRVIKIHLNGGNESTVSHEKGHLWDNMNPGKMRLFRSISWRRGLRREEDERDFVGYCRNPSKHSYVKPTNLNIRKEYIVCSDRNTRPYGMMNQYEDFAVSVENYFGAGAFLRKKALNQLRGSFTLSADEFVYGLKPKHLLREVSNKFTGFTFVGYTDLEKLNNLIKMPSFYHRYVKSLNLSLAEKMKNLAGEIDGMKNEKFTNLSKDYQKKVMELNRLLLEKIISICPKINKKIENVEPILKYLFVKYMTPFAGKEYDLSAEYDSSKQKWIHMDLGIGLYEIEERLDDWQLTHPNDTKIKRALSIIRKIKESRDFYKVDGPGLRDEVREDMEDGEFDSAIKYLRMKYKVFRGKEFLDPDEDKPLTAEEIKKALDKWIKDNPGTVKSGLIRTINNYARRYKRRCSTCVD